MDGRKLFESTCATCHGLDGRGAERGPNIATRAVTRKLSDAEILVVLKNGRPNSGMPPFGALGSPKLASLLSYLRSLQGLGKQEIASGDAAQGSELFLKSAGCVSCHTVNGAGGFLGPDLSTYGAVTPFVEMREQIAHHDQSLRARTVTLATRDGQRLTGIVRNEDNFSLQLQTLDGKFHFLDRFALTPVDTKPADDQNEQKAVLSSNEIEALVSYLVDAAKIANANGKLKRRPVHHEEDD